SGTSGTATGTSAWTATIPLAIGNNDITITVTDSAGATGTAMFSVLYSPPPRTTTVGQTKHHRCGMATAQPVGFPAGLLLAGLLALSLSLTPRRSHRKG